MVVRRELRSANGTGGHLLSAKGREGARRTALLVQDRLLGGAGRIGRVYEGTHKGCPYGCWERGAGRIGRVCEGTHEGCPYGCDWDLGTSSVQIV